MFHIIKILNRRIRWIFLLSVGFAALGFMGPIAALGAGPAPVNLGSAGDFVILAETGITDTGSHTSAINGDIGNSPGSATQMGTVWCSQITGTIYGVDAAYTGDGIDTTCFAGNPPLANKTLVDNAVIDMLTAYNTAAGIVSPAPVIGLGAGDIGGLDIPPGLYKWSNDVIIPTNVTLSGGANDVWIFQIAGNLDIASAGDVASGIKVLLIGGAQASNIFWQVGGVTGATLGTYATFNGTILSAKQIILETGAVLNGRALAQTQVTLDANSINEPLPGTGCPIISFLPEPPLTIVTVGSFYSQTITASGGTEPYDYSLTDGSLPNGLSLLGDTISGIPTVADTFTFTVTATDDNGCNGSQAYTRIVNAISCPPISLPAPPLPGGTVGDDYNETISADGAGTYTYSITRGSLPNGLSLNTVTGLISGPLTAAGRYDFTVTATDANGCSGLQAYVIVINVPTCPSISLSSLPQGTLGAAYDQTITVIGGTGTYSYSITAGSLPNGLSLDPGTGRISGTLAPAGTFPFTVTAINDRNGCPGFRAYTLYINSQTAAIPTLSEWGMIFFMVLLGLSSFYYMRRRKEEI